MSVSYTERPRADDTRTLLSTAQEGRRVGRDRSHAVHDPDAADSEVGRPSMTSTSTKRLVEAASAVDSTTELIVLLGGEAGLRCGEMIALEWRTSTCRSANLRPAVGLEWRGHFTERRTAALRPVDPATGVRPSASIDTFVARECCVEDDGTPLTRQQVQYRVRYARQKGERAGRASTSCGTRSVRTWRCAAPRASDSGTRRSPRARRDSALHAPESRGARSRRFGCSISR